MKYRPIQTEDIARIKVLCDKNNIAYPHQNSVIFLAEDGNEIVGFIGITSLPFIEPLISENPVVANNLHQMAIGFLLAQDAKDVFCYCNQDKIDLFSKSGFNLFQDNVVIMKKELF
jgi:hypothetical protein